MEKHGYHSAKCYFASPLILWIIVLMLHCVQLCSSLRLPLTTKRYNLSKWTYFRSRVGQYLSARTVNRQHSRLQATAGAPNLSSLLEKSSKNGIIGADESTQFVFVGGKGGVGKTSSSSAMAISMSDSGLRTLIVSTDPAHSLGDALDVNLRSGNIVPIATETNLWALEIDVDSAIEDFKATAAELDPESLAASLGVPRDIIETLGLSDLASIFTNPPPGIDEIVALTKIFQYADEKGPNGTPKWDRIVIDTAPTGHTVRLLQLPVFLNSITGKLIKFRAKLMGAIDTFKGLFGGGSSGPSGANTLSGALSKLEDLQSRIARVRSTLTDADKTQFVVVTIPTTLAVAESKRLVNSLNSEGIRVSSIVCNQVVADTAGPKYLQMRQSSQRKCIDAVSAAASTALKADSLYAPIEITEVPFVDTEVTGIYGLRFFGALAHPPKVTTATNPIDSRKLTIFGGKGGVGKTTSAASWAVQLSDHGMKTLVISTDPAHSLGDAFQEKLSGVPRLLDQNAGSGGQLWAMEVDPESALDEFRDLMKGAMQSNSNSNSNNGAAGGMGLPDFKSEISDMLSGVNDPPPGTDEVVAMTKVVTYLEDGITLPNGSKMRFDRIVLDTAPTGHTLRMLQLPDFLQQLVQKLKKIRDKAGTLGGMFGAFTGAGAAADTVDQSLESIEAQGRLDKFQSRMERLEELLHNPRESEFAVVTIPTEVASAETVRLVASLRDEGIGLRRLIINQVIPKQGPDGADVAVAENAANAYLNRLRMGQQSAIKELQQLADSNKCELIKVPYFDMEVRTVYGLRVVGSALFSEKKL